MIEGKDYFLVKKSDSKFMRFLGKLLFFNKDFMTRYVTTIGKTIYHTDDSIHPTTLKHELKHVKQWNKWNILFSLSFLLLLPSVLTMRSYWEKQAYKISIQETYKLNPNYAKSDEYRDHITKQFTSAAYLYMWPFKKSMHKWIKKVLEECKEP